MKEINILYSIDELSKDYSRYLGVSILSLLQNNLNENIHIYILSEMLEESNKNELIRIVDTFGKKITFSEGKGIVPEKFKKILLLKRRHPLASYYRLFMLEKFDIDDRILYFDCDTIIYNNISEFYNSDFEGNIFIGNLDLPLTVYERNRDYGLSNYINAGVLLINIPLFKKIQFYEIVKEFNEKYGVCDYSDQEYINFMFKDKIKLYNKLQYIAFYKRFNFKYNEYLVIHAMRKPNTGGYSFCPKFVEEMFNNYLTKTKRKTYVGWERKMSIKLVLGYFYDYIQQFCVCIALQILGIKCAYNIDKFFSGLMKYLGFFLKNICKIVKI